jgi:hypothetical protein
MKSLLNIIFFITISICTAQSSGITNVEVLNPTSNYYLNVNGLYGGSDLTIDGDYILAKSKNDNTSNAVGTAIINGFEYENVLKSNSNLESYCDNADIGNDNIIIWGAANIGCCTYDLVIQVYDKNLFPHSNTNTAAPTNVNPLGTIRLLNINGGGRINDAIQINDYIYFSLVESSPFNYENVGSFGTITGSFNPSTAYTVMRFNMITGQIDQSYSFTEFVNQGSLTVFDNDKLLVSENIDSDTANIYLFNEDLSLLTTIGPFYNNPPASGLYLDRPLLIDGAEIITTTSNAGDAQLLVPNFIIGGINQNDDNDIIRKIVAGTVDPTYRDETGIGATFFPNFPHRAVVTDEHYVFLDYRNNARPFVTFINKETGSFDTHQSLMLTDDNGEVASGLWVEDMVYDEVNNQLDFLGTYVATNKYLGDVLLPDAPGHVGIRFSYNIGLDPQAEVDLAVIGYPNAGFDLEGNKYIVSGIPEAQWNNLTLDVSFTNNSSYTLATGNGSSFTKDFTDDELDYFSAFVPQPQGSGTLDPAKFPHIKIYIVEMTTEMSIIDQSIETTGVYPNPSLGIIYIPDELLNSDLHVYNYQGRLIDEKNNIGNRVALHNLPRGIYVFKFINQNGHFIQKVIID